MIWWMLLNISNPHSVSLHLPRMREPMKVCLAVRMIKEGIWTGGWTKTFSDLYEKLIES
jgi:hypothetical protein